MPKLLIASILNAVIIHTSTTCNYQKWFWIQ